MNVREYADFEIKGGSEVDFEAAVAKGVAIFRRAEGCIGVRLERLVERPNTYRLVIQWVSIEHHTEIFRHSDLIEQWRELVKAYLVTSPQVVHSRLALHGFGDGAGHSL